MNNKTTEKQKPASIFVQIGIYATILFVSSLISQLFPASFPMPTPVIGLIILYILLTLKIIKPAQIEQSGNFLIGMLAFLFVPSGIQLAASLDIMAKDGVRLVLMIFISTVVMLVSIAMVAAGLIWLRNKFSKENK